MITDTGHINNASPDEMMALNKSKKKRNENRQIKEENGINGNINYTMQNQLPIAPVNPNNPMCFNTGFYFNNVPNHIHINNVYKQEELINLNHQNIIQNEFINNIYLANEINNHQESFQNQESKENSPKPSKSIKGKKRNNNNDHNKNHYPNGNMNPKNVKDSDLKKNKKELFNNKNKNNFNGNVNLHNNISKSPVNKSHFLQNEIQSTNQVYSHSQPNLMPVMGFPFGFNPNPQFINNPIYANMSNSNQINQYFGGQIPNPFILTNDPQENSFRTVPHQNFKNWMAIQNFPAVNSNNNNNYIGNPIGVYSHNVALKPEKNLINNEYFYPQKQFSNSDDVIDKTKFLNEFADFNNYNIGKSKETISENSGKIENTKVKSQNKFDYNSNSADDKKSKNKASKKTKQKDQAKAKEENEFINFNNFKEMLVENDIANKEGNLVAFSKKLSTVEENKDGKSLIQNNYQVTIINGYNLNENSENKKNFNLEEKLLNRLRGDNTLNPSDLTHQTDYLAIKSTKDKNIDFLNYLENPEPTGVKQSKEEKFNNQETSNKFKSKDNSHNIFKDENNNNNNGDFNEKEFYDFNEIMKKNSNNKTPNVTSDYYAYKFTSGGESLKLDLNFDKEFYQSTRQITKQKVELFIPIDEDDFKNKIENNSKKQEEKEIRHTLQIIKGGCGSGSHINITHNENLNESFDKEFGDSYGPKKSKFNLILLNFFFEIEDYTLKIII